MILSMIVAYTKDEKGRLIIGKDGALPWNIPSDMVWFAECTRGHAIIMGRKTYESIGRPLPGRDNIVMSSDPDYQVPGATVFADLNSAILFAGVRNHEVFIIGGQTLYEQCLGLVERIYVTYIENNPGYEGDTFFPNWTMFDFKVIQKDSTQDENNGTVSYTIFQRYKYAAKSAHLLAAPFHNTGRS